MSKSKEWQQNKKACPPEIFERFGKLTVANVNGRLYAKIKGKSTSIAKLVWRCHKPNGQIAHRQAIYHLNGDKLDNTFENLTMWSSQCRRKT